MVKTLFRIGQVGLSMVEIHVQKDIYRVVFCPPIGFFHRYVMSADRFCPDRFCPPLGYVPTVSVPKGFVPIGFVQIVFVP